MFKLHRLDKIENIDDEYNTINNVVAYIVAEFIGHQTVVGYVYLNENNKLRREWAGWL